MRSCANTTRQLLLGCGAAGFDDGNELTHRRECSAQFVGTDFASDPVAPGMGDERDSANGPVAGLGTGEQFGASMIRIGAVLRETTFDQQIGDALHALPSQAHAAADRCHAARLVQDAAKHLPPGGGQVAVGGEILSGLEEPCVEPESRQDEISQYGAGFGVRDGLGPGFARRHLAVARVLAEHSCGVLGLHENREAGRIAPMEDGLVRLERAIGRQAELLQRRPGELNGRLRPRGDQAIVCDGTLIDEGAHHPHTRCASKYSAAALVWRRESSRPALARPAVAPQMAATGTPASQEA